MAAPKPPAVAPYNFVSLAERCVDGQEPPRFDRYDANRFTGHLDVELTTLTPIYVRGAIDPQRPQDLENGQPTDFFHRGDPKKTPVIPGSTLRGMIRGVFEILTWSRLEFISPRRLFYRSFADPAETGLRELYQRNFDPDRFVAGVIVARGSGLALRVSLQARHGFAAVHVEDPRLDPKIRGARDRRPTHELRTCYVRPILDARGVPQYHTLFQREASGDAPAAKLDIAKFQVTDSRDGSGTPGYLVLPGKDMPPRKETGRQKPETARRWYQVILDPGDRFRDYVIPAQTWHDYRGWRELTNGAWGALKPRELKEGEAAFGVLDESGNVVVLGANMMMPLRYKHSLAEIAAKQQDTVGVAKRDMTRAVFGFVPASPTDDRDAVKSRVSFEDAVCVTPEPLYSQTGVYPDVLASPKPTSFQMYARSRDGRPVHWDDPEAAIRGFKRYWHQSAERADAALHSERPAGANEQMSTTIRPVKSGVRFTGRVHFENLTSEEFGALIASVQLPEGLAHKVGMAKNLGLGSVDVRITGLSLVDAVARYRSFAPNAGVERIADFRTSVRVRDAYSAFVRYVVPQSKTGGLWDTGRTRDLALMLSIATMRDADQIRQVGLNDTRQWKERHVLPVPGRVPVSPSEPATVADPERALARDIFPIAGPVVEPTTASAPRRVVAAGETPAARPSGGRLMARDDQPAAAVRVYRQSESIKVTVLEITGIARGTVELPDGSRLVNQAVGRCGEGETVTVKVMRVDGHGKIKEVRRA
jgi:CRISPR-associated protein (TIGR03986 family)